MRAARYVIPEHGLGTVCTITAEDVNEALVREVVGAARNSPWQIAVSLIGPDLDIYLDSSYLGTVSAADAATYPELGWIREAGFTPQVTAWAIVENGEASLILRMPRPGMVLPANNPPADPWVLLGGGYTVAVAPRVPTSVSNRHVLATLTLADDGEVDVSVDNEPVGRLDAHARAALAPTLRELQRRGYIAVARGYHTPPALVLSAAPMEPTVRPLAYPFPALPPMPRAAHAPVVELVEEEMSAITHPRRWWQLARR